MFDKFLRSIGSDTYKVEVVSGYAHSIPQAIDFCQKYSYKAYEGLKNTNIRNMYADNYYEIITWFIEYNLCCWLVEFISKDLDKLESTAIIKEPGRYKQYCYFKINNDFTISYKKGEIIDED